MLTLFPFFLAMVACIVILNIWAKKLKIAYPILLVIAGLLISMIPKLPTISINPDYIFFIFLPPLLCEAAWNISYKEMKRWWRIVGSFAFIVVFFTALSVAIVANHFIPGFTIALGFLLGGIVSPPDAVSTGAITKFVKIPKSISAILEGESLLNDASSLIILRFALIAIGTGQFIWTDAIFSFTWMIIGGTGIGLLLGWIFVFAQKKMKTDAPSDIALTLIQPYLMYWIAEEFEASGVLAVVAGSLYMSSKRLVFLNSTSRIKGFSVWESFVFILNGLVFLIIGLMLPEIIEDLKAEGIPPLTAITYGILVTFVLIIARILSAIIGILITYIFRPKVLEKTSSPKKLILFPLVLGWTGMRGVVSLAAALSIPLTLNGEEFPHRNLILFITFVVILLTLLAQGLTLPYFIRKSKIFDEFLNENLEKESRKTFKNNIRQHIHSVLKKKYENEENDDETIKIILKQWEERTQTIWLDKKTKKIYLELLESQRTFLVEMNKDQNINEEMIRNHLYQLDLEEERLKIIKV